MGQAPLFEEPTLTVGELGDLVARAISRAFPDEFWVRGEIVNLSRTRRGDVYFDLADDRGRVSVVLWDRDRQVVNRVLTNAGGAVRMTDGTDVRIRVRATWFARRGSLSLRMLSIDPAYTLGQLAEAREQLLAALRADGTLGRNALMAWPLVPLRVGLITSHGSAAEADFVQTLEASGFAFAVASADARVQGVEAELSLVAALRSLGARHHELDVICVVRGGGARTDLAVFDRESVARVIAATAIPVCTGIGHEIDTSVADHAADSAFKTPTACAAALVDRVAAFVDGYTRTGARIGRAAEAACDRAVLGIEGSAGRVVGASRHHVRAHSDRLERAATHLARRSPRALDAAARDLDGVAARVRALDPVRTLARGWSITRRGDGELLRSASALEPGDSLVTTFADGAVASQVTDGTESGS